MPDDGYFGIYGGRFVPETLIPALDELDALRKTVLPTRQFREHYDHLLTTWAGRPTPIYEATRLAARWVSGDCRVFFKREDLNHTGAHKILNALGQGLLAKLAGKGRIVAETGAGQHGVAVASVCAMLDLKCVVYMGAEDMRRQAPNVARMDLLGAKVVPVTIGTQTLKDATSEAIRDWVTNVRSTHYLIGSVVGPHPFPTLVRSFAARIGQEARAQCLELTGALPAAIVACVGGGSNSIGIFHEFLGDKDVALYGVEAGGTGPGAGAHAATLRYGSPGVLHGAYSYLLQSSDGQISSTHSISAGLDYPGVGPELSALRDSGRVQFVAIRDRQARDAFNECARYEGIIPALESAHALAFAKQLARDLPKGSSVLINLSGRGDKDLAAALAPLTEATPAGKKQIRRAKARVPA